MASPGLVGDPGLHDTFRRARRLGLVGSVDPGILITHALGFAAGIDPPDRAVDLGSGAGIPGLVLACHWPASQWLLVEISERRATFLESALRRLDLASRVRIAQAAAEEVARQTWRATAEVVTARSFGPPAVVAECAAGFLRVGGVLVVSEPPEGDDRWAGVTATPLGLEPDRRWVTGSAHYQSLRQVRPCPDRYPRRAGVPSKRPLF